MSDIKLFRLDKNRAAEIRGTASDLEKPLQTLIEENLNGLLGIRFVATEHSTGRTHAGRIDTLGLDEDNCPVIIEYKSSTSENVINQGLFYLDWLMDHQAEFRLLVQERYGKAVAESIDWSGPRVVCIAGDFTKYDNHAVQQMNRNIELIRYRRFGDDLLLLELANAVEEKKAAGRKAGGRSKDKTVAEWMRDSTPAMRVLFDMLERYILSLGDDVQRKELKLYVAYKRLRNIATVEIRKTKLMVFLPLDPDKFHSQGSPLGAIAGLVAGVHRFDDGFMRDVRKIGHWGTGDLEVTIKNLTDLEKAKRLILMAYEGQ